VDNRRAREGRHFPFLHTTPGPEDFLVIYLQFHSMISMLLDIVSDEYLQDGPGMLIVVNNDNSSARLSPLSPALSAAEGRF
jgi:hypothetical protein